MKNNLKIPNHVGIIVDGNGRWATSKGKNRSYGHKEGASNLKKLIKHIFNSGIKVFSAYIFSTENFKRSNEEVNYLMDLFVTAFKNEFKEFKKENIKIVFSGTRENLSSKVLDAMDKIVEDTKDNTRGILNFCLNYGSHREIIDAAKKICKDALDGNLNIEDLDETLFNKYLYNDLPPIDLLIRTSGEMRLSNFMLYQLSYAELIFVNTYFPDFNEEEFDKCLLEYSTRDRRFGGISDKNSSKN